MRRQQGDPLRASPLPASVGEDTQAGGGARPDPCQHLGHGVLRAWRRRHSSVPSPPSLPGRLNVRGLQHVPALGCDAAEVLGYRTVVGVEQVDFGALPHHQALTGNLSHVRHALLDGDTLLTSLLPGASPPIISWAAKASSLTSLWFPRTLGRCCSTPTLAAKPTPTSFT